MLLLDEGESGAGERRGSRSCGGGHLALVRSGRLSQARRSLRGRKRSRAAAISPSYARPGSCPSDARSRAGCGGGSPWAGYPIGLPGGRDESAHREGAVTGKVPTFDEAPSAGNVEGLLARRGAPRRRRARPRTPGGRDCARRRPAGRWPATSAYRRAAGRLGPKAYAEVQSPRQRPTKRRRDRTGIGCRRPAPGHTPPEARHPCTRNPQTRNSRPMDLTGVLGRLLGKRREPRVGDSAAGIILHGIPPPPSRAPVGSSAQVHAWRYFGRTGSRPSWL